MQPYGYRPYTPYPPAPTPLDSQRQGLRRAGSFIGVGMLFLIAFSQFLYTALVFGLMALGLLPADAVYEDALGLGNTPYLLIYMSVYAVMMGVPMLLAGPITRTPLRPFAAHKKVRPLLFLAAVVAGMAMCVVANLVANYMMSFFNALGIPNPAMPELLIDTPVSLALNLFIFAVLPALLEEMVFRGCVLQSLRPYGDRTALWVSSLLFALMHGNVLQVPFAFIVGLVLGYAVLRTNNIWLAVAIHFANNAMATLLDYAALKTSPDNQNTLVVVVFAALGLIGMLILFILRARNHPLTAGLPKNEGNVATSSQLGVLFTSPAFLISFILFILLVLLNVATSVLQAGLSA